MTNLQVALRLTNPIDASGTVALNDSGSGINDQNNFGHISASSLGATSFTWVTPIFTSAPNPITLADVGGGTLIAELFGVSPKTLTSNGAWIEGPVFNVPARNAQTVDAKIGQNYKMSDPLITVQNTNGFFGGTGTARTVSSTGGTATRQYSLSDGTETVYVAYETADTVNQGPGATPFEWRNVLSYVMKHKTRLTISTSGLTISDGTGTLASNLGLAATFAGAAQSKRLGDVASGYVSGTGFVWIPDLGSGGGQLQLRNVSVGNIPVATSGSAGSLTISKSGITRSVAWTASTRVTDLASAIQNVLRDPPISSSGTADFGTTTAAKVTIAAPGKTLTLTDSNAGASGLLSKLNLPTSATASPVASTATVATPSGACDAIPPTVSTITTAASGTKRVGGTVSITVTFSEPVTTTGASSLLLETGTTDTPATCPAVTASTTLTCTYTVTSGDTATGLDIQSRSALTGTITDVAGNAYVSANGLPALATNGLYGANLIIDGSPPPPSGGNSPASEPAGGASAPGSAVPVATPTPTPVRNLVTFVATPVSGAGTVRVTASGGRIADLGLALADTATGRDLVRSVVEAPTGDQYAVNGVGRLEWLDPANPATAGIVAGATVSRLPIAAIETLELAPPSPGTVLWDVTGISGHSLCGVGADGLLHALPEGPVDPTSYRTDKIVPLISIIQLARLPIGLPDGFGAAKAPPTVFAIERAYGAQAVAETDELTFTVVFSEPVTGVSRESFRIAPGTTWRVSVDATGATGTGIATIGNEVLATGITNAAGVALVSGVTTDHEERFRLARTVPVVLDITRTAGASELLGRDGVSKDVSFTVVLSEPVTGVAPPTFSVVTGQGLKGSRPVVKAVGGTPPR